MVPHTPSRAHKKMAYLKNLCFVVFNHPVLIIPVQSMGFADDCVILCRDKDVEIIRENLQEAITCIQNWANETAFTFSTTKTKCFHFNGRTPLQSVNPLLTL